MNYEQKYFFLIYRAAPANARKYLCSCRIVLDRVFDLPQFPHPTGRHPGFWLPSLAKFAADGHDDLAGSGVVRIGAEEASRDPNRLAIARYVSNILATLEKA
jgi:hypothetical protein